MADEIKVFDILKHISESTLKDSPKSTPKNSPKNSPKNTPKDSPKSTKKIKKAKRTPKVSDEKKHVYLRYDAGGGWEIGNVPIQVVDPNGLMARINKMQGLFRNKMQKLMQKTTQLRYFKCHYVKIAENIFPDLDILVIDRTGFNLKGDETRRQIKAICESEGYYHNMLASQLARIATKNKTIDVYGMMFIIKKDCKPFLKSEVAAVIEKVQNVVTFADMD